MNTFDESSDPYLFKNQLGSYECRLCLGGMFNNIGSYIAHIKGK